MAVNPGEVLRKVLREQGISEARLARSAGWTAKHLSQVCTGKAPISVELAFDLEEVTGVPALDWLKLQARYDVERVREVRAAQVTKGENALERARKIVSEALEEG